MKVRLTTNRAGRCGEQHDGEIIEVDREEGLRLLRSRQAEPVEHGHNTERAEAPRNKEKRGR